MKKGVKSGEIFAIESPYLSELLKEVNRLEKKGIAVTITISNYTRSGYISNKNISAYNEFYAVMRLE